MEKFTKKQMNELNDQIARSMEQLSEGKDVKEICAQMYVDGLEGKTLFQGEAMAESILDSIAAFDRDYARAKADVDAYVDSFVDEACEGKTLEERCAYLTKLIAAVCAAEHTLHANSDAEREQALALVEEADVARFFEGEATELLEQQLIGQLKNALKGSNILLSAIEEQRAYLLEIENEDEAAELLVDAGARGIDYRAILSMQAYINIKNGAYEGIPSDLTAAQTAAMVCTYVEEIHILRRLELKEIGLELANGLLFVLGSVAILRMAVYALGIGTAVCAGMFSGILMIPAMLVMVTAICHAGWKLVDLWMDTSKKIVRVTAVGVEVVCSMAGAVLNAAVRTLSWMVKQAAAAVKRLLQVLRRGRGAQQAGQTAVVEAQELECAIGEEHLEEELFEEEYETQ